MRISDWSSDVCSSDLPIPGLVQPAPVVFAQTTSNAVAVDGDGFTYVVGTTTGDLGLNRGDGDQDLFLTKMDSEGEVVWQRLLGAAGATEGTAIAIDRSEEHTSELQSLMRISYAVFCLKKK